MPSSPTPPLHHWSFDTEEDKQDITGPFQLVQGVIGQALKSNEFGTELHLDNQVCSGSSFTLEAWIAPQTYPWNTCPILTQQSEEGTFYFGINYQGQLQLHVLINDNWVQCDSLPALPGLHERMKFAGEGGTPDTTADFGEARPCPTIPLLQWSHVAATVDEGILALYLNGEALKVTRIERSPEQAVTFPQEPGTTLFRTTHAVLPCFLARERGNQAQFCSWDGLLDEIKVYDRALSPQDVQVAYQEVCPPKERPLQFRRMPTAQDQPGGFGAFYTHLPYDKDWDATRRMGDQQDVFVRFENNPCTFVAWNGTIYPVLYPDGGNIGQMFEAFETWTEDGCNEAMMDRRNERCSWRILENTPARVVIHWRHALVAYSGSQPNMDPRTGWSDWVDDVYTIYPDATIARKTTLWSSNLISNHSYAQDDSVIQPGFMPWEVYERDALSVANLQGQETTITLGKGHHGPADKSFQEPAVIQRHNFKSTWKPFMIAPPHEVFSGEWTNEASYPWHLPCWHHWPTAQLIDSDGSCTFLANGRPTSSCITNGWGYGDINRDAVELTEHSLTRYSLIGMTDGPTADLTPLANFWRTPPDLTTLSPGFTIQGFNLGEKAYHLTRTNPDSTELTLSIHASEEKPLVHPAFVIRDWGETTPKFQGVEAEFGFRKRPIGTDLIVWIKHSSSEPIEVTIG